MFPHGFPREFSVVISVRPKYSLDSDLYVLVITDEDGDIEFGIQYGDVPSIVYRYVSIMFTNYPWGKYQHYDLGKILTEFADLL